MAELILATRQSSGATPFHDGDIIHAFNRRRIETVHIDHICHPWKETPDRDGRIPDHLARPMYEARYEFRFERISRTEARKIRIATRELVKIVGPDTADIDLFVRRALAAKRGQNAKRAIFGTPGREIWYGGRTSWETARINALWTTIESRSPLRRADHQLFPLGRGDRSRSLVVRVAEFDDATRTEYESPETAEDRDGNTVTVWQRRNFVDWRTILNVDVTRVLDREEEYDLRDSENVVVVQRKL